MMKQVIRSALGFGCTLLLFGGCAKQELVKKDQSIAPAQSSSASQHAAANALKAQPVTQEPIKESTATNSLQPISGAEELKAALNPIYFDFDAFTLSQTARDTLAKNANVLKKGSSAAIRIEGHCDERGSDDYNLALGERRAKTAMQYLVTLGIPAENVSVLSYGKEKPADPGHDEAAWAKNRRDEFILTR